MTINKTIQNTSLLIEVTKGMNEKGETTYTKKSFANISPAAAPENVYNVAKAISEVLALETRRFYLRDTSLVVPISNQ